MTMSNIRYINASAGTGKTYTLTHDLATLLSGNKLKPSEIIATTFTVAAAAEIKSRARQVLLEKGLIPEAAQIDTAAIGTIHSVAQMFLKKYWYILGATPVQDVMSDSDKKIYRNRSISLMLQNNDYSKQREAINRYFEAFRPQRYKDSMQGKEDNPDFWTEDLEKIVGKITYYNLSDAEIEDSKAKSKQEFNTYFKDCQIGFDCIDAIFDLAKAWIKEYEQFKLDHSVIDFDDMEKSFLELLNREEVVNDIRSNYKLVMVDEFQDCNPIQLKIFTRLAEIITPIEGLSYNSIWVGDPKQSIYGFRGANTALIQRIVNDLKAEELTTSYRTRESLVEATNSVFLQNTFFPDMAKLGADRKDKQGMHKSVMQWHFEDKKPAEYIDHLVRTIKDFVQSKEYNIEDKETKQLRNVEYKDIAILCHKNHDITKIVNALNLESIPAIAPEKDIITRAEIQLLLSLLMLSEKIDTPHEIATVLHLLYDWDTEDILRSRINTGEDWLADSPELNAIKTVIRHTKGMTISEKVSTFIIEFGLYDKVKKWGEQEVRKLNLKTFYAHAKNFEAYCNRFDALPIFLDFRRYLNSVNETVSINDNNAAAVKVTTYHRSKGLEWPVVILDGLCDDDAASIKSFKDHNLFGVDEIEAGTDPQHPSYYLRYFPRLNMTKYPIDDNLILASAFFKDRADRSHAEMKNLLYVSATRARDYLILLSNGDDDAPWIEGIKVSISDFNPVRTDFQKLRPSKVNPPKPLQPGAPKRSIDAYDRNMLKYQEYISKIQQEEDYLKERSKPKPYTLRDIADIQDQDLDPRYISPSKLGKSDASKTVEPKMYTVCEVADNSTLANIDEGENNSAKTPMNIIGTCIHKIYAACPSKGTKPTPEEREQFISIATQIITNFNLCAILTSPEEIVDSLYSLYAWLTQRYGAATAIYHEYPFNFPLNDQQVIKGEIDLIWQTAEGDVIVDFKNINGTADELLTPGSNHYVGHHYIPQLLAYKDRLIEARHNVIDCVLYYNIGKAVVF